MAKHSGARAGRRSSANLRQVERMRQVERKTKRRTPKVSRRERDDQELDYQRDQKNGLRSRDVGDVLLEKCEDSRELAVRVLSYSRTRLRSRRTTVDGRAANALLRW